ncbi:hypothetical protein PYW08_000521 [Mythimna loreyi]|uniref:Uncharacterized protein n=1 Tax=Mythimna loreyi TaxID=667449 RepID=A0ACC2RCP3_9NEOP|nr:hypothetical protein PYW08_000521 [Mythimna loreyi]
MGGLRATYFSQPQDARGLDTPTINHETEKPSAAIVQQGCGVPLSHQPLAPERFDPAVPLQLLTVRAIDTLASVRTDTYRMGRLRATYFSQPQDARGLDTPAINHETEKPSAAIVQQGCGVLLSHQPLAPERFDPAVPLQLLTVRAIDTLASVRTFTYRMGRLRATYFSQPQDARRPRCTAIASTLGPRTLRPCCAPTWTASYQLLAAARRNNEVLMYKTACELPSLPQ